jgi:hypothetical protein
VSTNTELPELNADLLHQAVEFAATHLYSGSADRIVWDQEHWRKVSGQLDENSEPCGTTMCLAGITCHLTGGVWLDNRDALRPVEGDDPNTVHTGRGIPFVPASCRAQRLLGLTFTERYALFDGEIETIDKLRDVADKIKNNYFRQGFYADHDTDGYEDQDTDGYYAVQDTDGYDDQGTDGD